MEAMSDIEIKALRLIESGGRGFTRLSVILVSRSAERLLRDGLVRHAPMRRSAYALTSEGRAFLSSTKAA